MTQPEAGETAPTPQAAPPCALCSEAGGHLLWQNTALRVLRVDDTPLPGFTRVVWQAHRREMTDLCAADQQLLMRVVFTVEKVLRAELAPHKVNLAQLGNRVAHVHWHIIPRWPDDPYFPESPWSAVQPGTAAQAAQWEQQRAQARARLPRYETALIEALDALRN